MKKLFLNLVLVLASLNVNALGPIDSPSAAEGGQGSGGGNVTPDSPADESGVREELKKIKPILIAAFRRYEDNYYHYEKEVNEGKSVEKKHIPYLTFFRNHKPGKSVFQYIDEMVLRINKSDCLHKGEKVDASVDHPNPVVVGEICVSLRVKNSISSYNSISRKLVGILAHELLHKMGITDEALGKEVEQTFGHESNNYVRTDIFQKQVRDHLETLENLQRPLRQTKDLPDHVKCQIMQATAHTLSEVQPYSSYQSKAYDYFTFQTHPYIRRAHFATMAGAWACLTDEHLETIFSVKETELIRNVRKFKQLTVSQFFALVFGVKPAENLSVDPLIPVPHDSQTLQKAVDVVRSDLKKFAKDLQSLMQENNPLIYNETEN